MIDWTASAQEANSNLNRYFQLIEPQRKWMDFHILLELYCGEHLIESAIHYDETGTEAVRLTMVPYYSWDNREPGAMRVWIWAT